MTTPEIQSPCSADKYQLQTKKVFYHGVQYEVSTHPAGTQQELDTFLRMYDDRRVAWYGREVLHSTVDKTSHLYRDELERYETTITEANQYIAKARQRWQPLAHSSIAFDHDFVQNLALEGFDYYKAVL